METTKQKRTRKPTAYNRFFKLNYDSVRDKPPKERMKILAGMWNKLSKEQKNELVASSNLAVNDARLATSAPYIGYSNASVTNGKRTRKPTAYNKFLKLNYDSVIDKPPNERMKILAGMWNKLSKEEKDEFKSL